MAQATQAPKEPSAKAAGVEDPEIGAAKKAALDWVALVDGGKLDASWDDASAALKKAQPKAAWVKGLGESRATMGKVLKRTFLNHEVRMNPTGFPPGKYIIVRFTTAFEKHKDGAESVTVVQDGGRGLKLASYFVK